MSGSSPEGNFFVCEPRVEHHVNGEILDNLSIILGKTMVIFVVIHN